MSTYDIKKANFTKFYTYLANKIDSGVKQKAIAEYIGKAAPYINKIYLKKQKSCPVDTQEKVAKFFNISLVELLEEGRQIIEDSNTVESRRNNKNKVRSLEPDELIDQLNIITVGVKSFGDKLKIIERTNNELSELKTTLSIYSAILNELDEGISFFNTKRELIFSSNRWGFLDGLNVSVNPSIDSMLLHLRNFIENFDEVVDLLNKCYTDTISITIPVSLKNNKHFIFRVIPIYLEKKHKGWLLINKPATPPIAELKD